MQRAALPGDFFQLGTLLLNAMQMATFPFAIFGQTSGQMAGYAISLMSQAGRRALMPIWSGIEGVYEAAFRNVAIICKNKVSPLIMSDKIPLTVLATSDGSGLIDRGKSYRHVVGSGRSEH